MKQQFDLVIASDVIYLPECVQPLFDSIKYFVKETGKCILVSNRVRVDPFRPQIAEIMQQKKLKNDRDEMKIKDESNTSKQFRI